MKKNARKRVSLADVVGAAAPRDGRGQEAAASRNGGVRPVRDRWMAQLIQLASGRQPYTREPPIPNRTASPESPAPAHLPDRLNQAVRWGMQEREFARFETTLSRRATFGDFLRWARERAGRTPDQLARQVGLAAESVAGLEGGHTSPLEIHPRTMASLAKALDISIWTLLERVQIEGNGHALCEITDLVPARVTDPPADTVWSAGSIRHKERVEALALKSPARSPRKQPRLLEYRRAVYQAWRDEQHS
ncbi:MAG: helix-turn-helix transcriptional regulator [Armatimonadetes bacterium]|nr:helix-turn-helix transcriptional regulator [Armatimonadota bacterium]